jgi:hypothetical protein
MIITAQLTFKEYLKLQYLVLYRKGWVIYISIVGIIMFIAAIVQLYNEGLNNANSYFGLAFGGLIILMPYFIYIAAKKNFKTNSRAQEHITYEFQPREILVKGESFTSQLTWEKTYKVQELKNWILIYQNKAVFNAIPKRLFSDADLEAFKFIVRNIPGLKVKLKR